MLLDISSAIPTFLLQLSQFLLPFGLLALLACLAYAVWRSTDTPSNLPLPPNPPFLITLSPSASGPEQGRQSLADVRLLSPTPFFTTHLPPSPTHPPFTPSLLTRLFPLRRGPIRPLLRSRLHTPTNFIAYHRLFHRHQARPTATAAPQPQPTNPPPPPPAVPVEESLPSPIPTPPPLLRGRSLSESDLLAETPEEVSHSTMESSRQTTPDQEVKFTLKFLNDTQLEVVTSQAEKIGDFKRRQFASELSENKVVRLIFNGRVLDQDGKTLKEAGVFEHCVVHCLIVTPQTREGTSHASGGGGDGVRSGGVGGRGGVRGPEPGMFFVSLMGILLLFLWFICFNFGQQLFTQSAVVSLSVLTAIFLIGLIAFYLPTQPPNIN